MRAAILLCRRRLGLDSDSAAHLPVAFAFGGGEGWDRLAVYFATASGGLYKLCPVVPFGECLPLKRGSPPSIIMNMIDPKTRSCSWLGMIDIDIDTDIDTSIGYCLGCAAHAVERRCACQPFPPPPTQPPTRATRPPSASRQKMIGSAAPCTL